jgi:hypothetical protein
MTSLSRLTATAEADCRSTYPTWTRSSEGWSPVKSDRGSGERIRAGRWPGVAAAGARCAFASEFVRDVGALLIHHPDLVIQRVVPSILVSYQAADWHRSWRDRNDEETVLGIEAAAVADDEPDVRVLRHLDLDVDAVRLGLHRGREHRRRPVVTALHPGDHRGRLIRARIRLDWVGTTHQDGDKDEQTRPDRSHRSPLAAPVIIAREWHGARAEMNPMHRPGTGVAIGMEWPLRGRPD